MECPCTRTRLGSKGPLIHSFVRSSARRLCHADEAQQGGNSCLWCHCLDDIVVRMRKAMAMPWSKYGCFSTEIGVVQEWESVLWNLS